MLDDFKAATSEVLHLFEESLNSLRTNIVGSNVRHLDNVAPIFGQEVIDNDAIIIDATEAFEAKKDSDSSTEATSEQVNQSEVTDLSMVRGEQRELLDMAAAARSQLDDVYEDAA